MDVFVFDKHEEREAALSSNTYTNLPLMVPIDNVGRLNSFLKMGHPWPLLFKQTLQFLQQINVKNVHPVYGTGIPTHNLRDMSLLP